MTRTALPDHYQVLGVGPDASAPEIKAVFRKLARQHHPDVTGFLSPEAAAVNEARYKDISFAYYVLGDPAERQAYDEVVRLEALYVRRYTAVPNVPVGPSSYQDYSYPTERPESQLEEDWQQFKSRPFDWAERAGQFYVEWEWVLSILCIPLLVLLVTGRLKLDDAFIFMFSSASRPGVDSIHPMAGLSIGVLTAIVVTALVAAHAILTHRYSYKTNEHFRSDLHQRAGNLFSTLTIIGGFGGLIAGHYLL